VKPQNIYSYECCPICGCNEFYSCEAYVAGEGEQICLDIEPSKSKLSIMSGSYYALPRYWAACPKCNYCITKIDIKKLEKTIKCWLESEPIKNTSKSKCLHCNSNNALLWKLVAVNVENFKIRFNWARSFSYSFLFGAVFPLGRESNVCFSCGMVSNFSSYGSIKEKSHKRYLKRWPLK